MRQFMVMINSKTSFKFKDAVFAHLETWRPYTIFWCGLVSLAGACISYGDFPPIKNALLAFFIPMIGWIAGLYALDFTDRKLDTIQKKHRPIPSGRLSPKNAIIFAIILSIIGFILSFLLGFYNVFLVFIVAISVIIYAKLTKSRGIIGNINRGFITMIAFLFGVFSVNNTILISEGVLLISLIFLIHDTNSNLVGAIRDKEGDKIGGYMTVPVKYGDKNSVFISLILSIIWISMMLFLINYYSFLNFIDRFYLIFSFAFVILIGMYIFIYKSLDNFDRKKGLRAHEFFIAERITFASSIIFGMISSIIIPILIFLITFIITLVSQYLIRQRYEFMEII
jgi:4-hydroxybenzoate polyprenyltransferase/geranylgeranylglycerol-phosphate geranylgeranyltransferase